jgi:hypothetical protein
MVINYRLLREWPNTYSFTKAIAEDTVREFGKGLPIAVVRPSIGGYLIFVSHYERIMKMVTEIENY